MTAVGNLCLHSKSKPHKSNRPLLSSYTYAAFVGNAYGRYELFQLQSRNHDLFLEKKSRTSHSLNMIFVFSNTTTTFVIMNMVFPNFFYFVESNDFSVIHGNPVWMFDFYIIQKKTYLLTQKKQNKNMIRPSFILGNFIAFLLWLLCKTLNCPLGFQCQ